MQVVVAVVVVAAAVAAVVVAAAVLLELMPFEILHFCPNAQGAHPDLQLSLLQLH